MSQGIVMRGEMNEESKKVEGVPEGTYGLTTMPDSFQAKRVYWDPEKRKWDIDLEPELLDQLVKESALKYLDGPRKGELIEKYNLRDSEDPFFSHPEFNLWLDQGTRETNSQNSIDKIILEHFKERSEVIKQDGKIKFQGIAAEYEIVDKDYDKNIKNKETQDKLDLALLISNSDYTKKSKIAKVMSIRFDKNLEESDLNTLLMQMFEVSKSKAEEFITLCKAKPEILDLKYMIKLGIEGDFIKKSPTKGQYYFNGEVQIGRNYDQIEEFFMEPKNSFIVDELRELINK